MSPLEKALSLKRLHEKYALTQARQCLAFNDFERESVYWKKVVEILSKNERPIYADSNGSAS
jgi:hypothetical protein